MIDMELLSKRFSRFADKECKDSSPLYEFLSRCIAFDKEMLELAAHAREGQPVPNLLLGSVHYLLMSGYHHPLRYYYSSLTKHPKAMGGVFEPFKHFCREYRKEIVHLMIEKRVQTNEVSRSAYLYPSFCRIYELSGKPLALIELGSSAGLLLFWDQYSYSYGTGKLYGSPNSEVQITAEVKGSLSHALLDHSPLVTKRIGIDLHRIDMKNVDDYLWLKALIWPEHEHRAVLFEKAARRIINRDAVMLEGDGVILLPELIESCPANAAVCVYHTHVANQMSVESKQQLLRLIQNAGRSRDVFHLYNNVWDADLHLDYYINGKAHKEVLASTDGHGRSFEWKLKLDEHPSAMSE